MIDEIGVATVTYGNRGSLIEKTVRTAQASGIKHFCIVDNGSTKESKKVLRKLATDPFIKVITMKCNMGSSLGFKTAIQGVESISEVKYVFCLDDDNLISFDTPGILLNRICSGEVLFCLRYYDKDFLMKTDKELEVKRLENFILNKNSYSYFSLAKMFPMIKEFFIKRVPNEKKRYRMVCGGQGGMFFHKSIINRVGYQDTDYFLYYDDIEYSYRMHKLGLKLYMIPECEITDQETTLVNSGVKSYFQISSILENIRNMNNMKLHYGYRNRVVLEYKLITNHILYNINRSIVKCLIFPVIKILYYMKYKEINRIKEIEAAIKEGEEIGKQKTNIFERIL